MTANLPVDELVYFTWARQFLDEPQLAEHLIGLGLDALRMSAEPSLLIIGGGGISDPAQVIEAAQELINELSRPLAQAGDRWVTWWAQRAADAPGILHQRFGAGCRDMLALAELGLEAVLLDEARSAFGLTLQAFRHCLYARQESRLWTETALAMVGDLANYHRSYFRYGGMSTLLLSFSICLAQGRVDSEGHWSLLDSEAVAQRATRLVENLPYELVAFQDSRSLLTSLTGCLYVSLDGAVGRELCGDQAAAFRSEEYRREAEDAMHSCGTGLLQALAGFNGTIHTVNIARLLAPKHAVRAMARARQQVAAAGLPANGGLKWSDLDVQLDEYLPLARAAEARRGDFRVAGPRLN